jgi:putative transposase
MVVSARMEGGWPMTLSTAVLRPGDRVHCDGSEHQVLALAGTSVQLRTVDGAESVVLAGHLTASPGFAAVDSEPAPSVEACLGALDRELLAVGELH